MVDRSSLTLLRDGSKPLATANWLTSLVLRFNQPLTALSGANFAMDATDRLLAELEQNNQNNCFSFEDMIAEFSDDVLWLDRSNTNEIEAQLMKSQYAYIKFGMIL